MLTRSKSSGRPRRVPSRPAPRRGRTRKTTTAPPRRPPPARRDDRDDEDDDAAWRYPPTTHTGGKWRPQPPRGAPNEDAVEEAAEAAPSVSSWPPPPPSAGGKWGPPPRTHPADDWDDEQSDQLDVDLSTSASGNTHTQGYKLRRGSNSWFSHSLAGARADVKVSTHAVHRDEDDGVVPPPHHTRGKWAPGMAGKVRAALFAANPSPAATSAVPACWPDAVRKSGSTVSFVIGTLQRLSTLLPGMDARLEIRVLGLTVGS